MVTMTYNSDNRLELIIDGDGFTARCSQSCDGRTIVDGERVAMFPDNDEAPFPMDVEFDEAPTQSEVMSLWVDLDTQFADEFDELVQAVFKSVNESDDPLATIMDLPLDHLLGEDGEHIKEME